MDRTPDQALLLPVPGARDFHRLERIYQKALHYQSIDPEVAVIQARKASECLCRLLFRQSGLEASLKRPAFSLGLDELICALFKARAVPGPIQANLQLIQRFGNFGAHDQEDDTAFTAESIRPCIESLRAVVSWYCEQHPLTVPSAFDPNDAVAQKRRMWVGAIDNLDDAFNEGVGIVRRLVMKNESVMIRLLTLDMDGRDKKLTEILHREADMWRGIEIRALVLDPAAQVAAPLCGTSPSLERARQSIEHLRGFAAQHKAVLAKAKIRITVRGYDFVPMLTGCAINDDFAFVAPTMMDGGKIQSDNFAGYHAIINDADEIRDEYWITSFISWFDYLWSTAKAVDPAPAKAATGHRSTTAPRRSRR